MIRTRIAAVSVLAAAGLSGAALLAPAAQAAGEVTAPSWQELPAKVTSAQQVWYPSNTLGMGLHSTTMISAEKCGANYIIEALYGGGTAVKQQPSFDIQQVAGGDCDLEPHTFWGEVSKIRTKRGTLVISAGCGWNAEADKPVKGYDGGPCKRKDVKTDGGLITLLPKDPAGTSVQVESEGLSYGQLVAIAKGLKPLS